MSGVPWRIALAVSALFLLLGAGPVADAAERRLSPAPECENGKGIERELGERGFRVVVSGGYRMRDDRSVKVQIWENDDSRWVITEAFVGRNRTCVVRAGRGLHMLY